MAVNVSNATFGYDANGLQQAINNLQTKCVAETIAKINRGMADLRAAVDQAWVGQSAERFKSKMEEDANAVSSSIEEAGQALEDGVSGIVGDLSQVDDSISF